MAAAAADHAQPSIAFDCYPGHLNAVLAFSRKVAQATATDESIDDFAVVHCTASTADTLRLQAGCHACVVEAFPTCLGVRDDAAVTCAGGNTDGVTEVFFRSDRLIPMLGAAGEFTATNGHVSVNPRIITVKTDVDCEEQLEARMFNMYPEIQRGWYFMSLPMEPRGEAVLLKAFSGVAKMTPESAPVALSPGMTLTVVHDIGKKDLEQQPKSKRAKRKPVRYYTFSSETKENAVAVRAVCVDAALTLARTFGLGSVYVWAEKDKPVRLGMYQASDATLMAHVFLSPLIDEKAEEEEVGV